MKRTLRRKLLLIGLEIRQVYTMVRIVLDTNILISGLLYSGKPKLLLDLALEGKFESVSSMQMVEEFRKVIARPRFNLDANLQDIMINFAIRFNNIVLIKSKFKVIPKDPSDDLVIRTAYDGKASYIVSGDRHLLELKGFLGIKIVTANKMFEILNK